MHATIHDSIYNIANLVLVFVVCRSLYNGLEQFYENTSTMVTSDTHLLQAPTCICGVVYQMCVQIGQNYLHLVVDYQRKYTEDYSSFYEISYAFINGRMNLPSLIPQ